MALNNLARYVRSFVWVLALCAWCPLSVVFAQVTVTPAPGVNGAGVAKTTLTIPSGQALQINMATPAAPVITNSAAGTFANGAYKVTVTAIDAAGGQTMYPTAATCTVTAGTDDACIATWTAVTGAVSYRVWMSDVAGATPNKYWPVAGSLLTLTVTSGAMATVVDPATLPTSASAYRFSVGGTSSWFGSPITITQGTPATAIPALLMTSTWNDVAVTHLGYKHVITNAASASGSLPFQILGGTAGATNLFKVDTFGVVTIGDSLVTSASGSVTAGVTGYLALRSRIYSSADAAFELTNGAKTGYTTLSLGPLTGNTVNGTLSVSQVTTAINMATATGTGSGTITSANTAIPIGLILGVSCRVTPILAGAGLTTFSLGNGTDADMFGTTLAIAADTLINIANYTITAPLYNTATKSLVLTAAAGVFSTGILTCTTHYISLVPVGS